MSQVVRFVGKLSALPKADRAVLIERSFSNDPTVAESVRALIAQVKAQGDSALVELARRFDKVELQTLEVPKREWERALTTLSPVVRAGLERAAKNLTTVSKATLPPPLLVDVEPGVTVGRRADPLQRVGVYAPGGKAAYPSSVLMGAVPAKAAGVGEVIICSPPTKTGLPSDVVLAAAALAKADRVFCLGGAGAVAAMAYGTASVPRVDRIVGPGNAYVAEAKRQVAGDVAIDSPAGPSEILAVADEHADVEALANELLAQAEHDDDACCVALVPTEAMARALAARLEAEVPKAVRQSTVANALSRRGAVLWVDSLDEALHFVADFAPEHLLLALREPSQALERVRNAGTIFVGQSSSVAFGDYVTGANHVLPTAGAARRFSGLSVLDFIRWSTWQVVSKPAANSFAPSVMAMANSEGLPAHANAARHWQRDTANETLPPPRLRKNLEPLVRYLPKRPPCDIDLTDNTNLFGLPPKTEQLLATMPQGWVTRYPTPYCDALRAALAAEAQVDAEEVVAGCGSDDLLDAIMRAFAEPHERFAYCPPTFGIVPTFARANNVTPVAVPLDVDALVHSGARVIYLCSPNNPTGAVLPPGFVEKLIARTSAVVVLDEAYIDYAATESLVKTAVRSDRLIVIRTLSKAFGLAGLRVGWAVGPQRLIREVEKTRGPYKVGNVAERAAISTLTDDRAWVAEKAKETVALRERFAAALRERGFAPLPSEANFVLVPTKKPCEPIADRMRERQVSVRAFPALQGIGDAVRITIGPWPLMQTCLDALTEACR